MLIVGDAVKEKRAARRKVRSARNAATGPGVHYALMDMQRQGKPRNEVVEIDGERVTLADGCGFTDDPDVAHAARAKGLAVIPREKHVASGKVYVCNGNSELYKAHYDLIDWSHDAT